MFHILVVVIMEGYKQPEATFIVCFQIIGKVGGAVTQCLGPQYSKNSAKDPDVHVLLKGLHQGHGFPWMFKYDQGDRYTYNSH